MNNQEMPKYKFGEILHRDGRYFVRAVSDTELRVYYQLAEGDDRGAHSFAG